jgi:hypothetical protein
VLIVLAGEPVEAVVADNLVQIYHHDVLNPRYATCSYTMPFSDDPARPTRR